MGSQGRFGSIAFNGALFLIALVVWGCSGDDGIVAPKTGQVDITCGPSEVTPTWTLELPSGLSATGSGDSTLTSMIAGEYTLTWGPVPGWTSPSPNPVPRSLVAGAGISFDGIYTQLTAQTGTIVISPAPNGIDAPWHLSGPDAFTTAGAGSDTLYDRAIGDYTIVWQAISGFETPATETGTLFANVELAFTCTYAEELAETGSITVDPNPDVILAPWTLVAQEGTTYVGAGDSTLVGLAVGDYTLTWGDVAGWTTPNPVTVTQALADNGTLTFTESYVAQTGTITINPEPDSINAPWQITGLSGFSQSGSGDITLDDMAADSYTLTWGDVVGWVTPVGSDQILIPGGDVNFSGVYNEKLLVSIDIDDTATLNTAPGFMSLPGYNGSSIVASGITFTIFGAQNQYDRLNADPLLTDFINADGVGEKIGLRLEGLPAGIWDISSWHFDCDGWEGAVMIQLHVPGGTTEVLVEAFTFSTDPVNYHFVSDGTSVYELLFLPLEGETFRSRLNGLQIQRSGTAKR